MADVLELLIAERDRLNRAIAALGGPRRRGRPPGSTKQRSLQKKAKTKRRDPLSAEARQRQSEKMKKYWAAKRKAAKKEQS